MAVVCSQEQLYVVSPPDFVPVSKGVYTDLIRLTGREGRRVQQRVVAVRPALMM